MKAKELRPFAEKLITLSKRETLHARRLVLRDIHDADVVSKMFDTISSRYAQRPGGYTRIVKLGPRRGDAAEMALIELVGAESVAAGEDGGATEAAAAGKSKAAKPKAEPKAKKADKAAKPARDKDDGAPKKGARTKGAAKTRTESKGKAKSSAATRKVGKSGS
jgi:large subunit ribosomal protein L17